MDTVAAVLVRFPAGFPAAEAELAAKRIQEKTRDIFATVEKLLNRFDPASELSRLAALSDEEILAKCDPLVRPCHAAAFAYRDATGGAFNPRWRGPNTLDLGAIAKGFALDLAGRDVAALAPDGAGVLLDLGGNLKAVRGSWRIALADSGETAVLAQGEAVATSGTAFRGNHVKDARTGANAGTDGRSVSVFHPESAMDADALSTALFILGPTDGAAFLAARHSAARAVWTGGGRR